MFGDIHPNCLRVIFGGFLVHLILGTLYLWSVITPAVTAYLRGWDPSLTYHDTLIVYSSSLAVQGVFMLIGGEIEVRSGPRFTVAVGAAILVFGVFAASLCTTLHAMTPMNAAGSGRLPIAELLLNRGCAIDIQSKRGFTALMYAACNPSPSLFP